MGVEIYDLTGKRILDRTLTVEVGSVSAILELNEVPSGVYLMRVTAGSFVKTERIVVQR
jgi:hypothetical protein